MKKSIIYPGRMCIFLLLAVLNGVQASALAPWTVSPNDFRYDMSLYMDVAFKTDSMDYSRYDVAAFVGDECRGVAERLSLGNDGQECLYMRVRSNQESGEKVTFKYYDREADEVKPIDAVSFDFVSSGRLGYPSEPYQVKIIPHYDVVLIAGAGGTIDHPGGRIAEETELTVTATPMTGYHFDKWSDGVTDNPRVIIVDKDVNLCAEFAPNRYKLIYIVDDELYKEYEVEYGVRLEAEAYPEKEGHTFGGWTGLPETMPDHDVTVTGSFSLNSYNLNIYLNDELYQTLLLEFGAPIEMVPPILPEGMVFDGWKSDIPATMPAHDVDVYGTYSVESSISPVRDDSSRRISVCTLDGTLIKSDVLIDCWQNSLAPGIYIVDGMKYLIP